MPKSLQIPSWTVISTSLFDPFLPLIKRWAKTSKSKPSYTEQAIRSLVIKIFYIIAHETHNKPDYSSFLNPDFLKKYYINKTTIPNKIDNFSQIFEIRAYKTGSRSELDFHLMVIHRVFKFLTENYHISLKSELRKFKNISFLKGYELKLLVDTCYTHFSDKLQSYIQYGGVPALFSEYLTNFFDTNYTISKKYQARKITGSIFTPIWIINLMLQRVIEYSTHIDNCKGKNIGDLSVGYGGFLEVFLNSPRFQNGNFYGYDTDTFKIDILKLNHAILHEAHQPSIVIQNIHCQDTLLQAPSPKFDLLVGNPPWGAQIEKSKISLVEDLVEFAIKQYDSYSLFLIRNVLSLKENGISFLVLPETFLLNPNYEKLRRFLLKYTTIIEILHLGENVFDGVNMPSLVFGLRKSTAPTPHQIKIYQNVTIKSNLNESSPILRSQSDFSLNQGYVFDIFTDTEERTLIEEIDNLDCYRLNELVNNSRGVEIGKKGEVIQCYICNVWMPVPIWSLDSQTGGKYASCSVCKKKIFLGRLIKREKIIVDKEPKESPYARILLGEDVQKYVITGNNFIILNRRGIKYKPASLYQQKKLLIRKTSKKLLATIDYDNSYTIQVVYQFSLKESFKQNPFLLEFILGIITSRLLQFYYAKKYQYGHRKSFPHHIQKNILTLPIPKINFSDIEAKFETLYESIVICTMTLIFISHFNEHHTVQKGIQQTLLAKVWKNKTSEKPLLIYKRFENEIHQSYQSLIENPSIIEDIGDSLTFFQNELDSEVDQLFRALK